MDAAKGSRAFKQFAAKARRPGEEINPEDVLDLAVEGERSDAGPLRELSAALRRPHENQAENGSVQVPLGRWAEVTAAYMTGGAETLVERARDARFAGFSLAVLETVGRLDGVEAALRIGVEALDARPPRMDVVRGSVATLNIQTLPGKGIDLPETLAQSVRTFLHDLLSRDLEVKDLAVVCRALRGVGDETSIERVKRLSPFSSPWSGLERSVPLAIRKRLRRRKS